MRKLTIRSICAEYAGLEMEVEDTDFELHYEALGTGMRRFHARFPDHSSGIGVTTTPFGMMILLTQGCMRDTSDVGRLSLSVQVAIRDGLALRCVSDVFQKNRLLRHRAFQ